MSYKNIKIRPRITEARVGKPAAQQYFESWWMRNKRRYNYGPGSADAIYDDLKGAFIDGFQSGRESAGMST